jgi:hypothetical protein
MRGICFKEQLFDLTVKGRKTVTRRMVDRYNIGETLYLKEPYFINADGSIDYKFDNRVKREKWKNKLFMPERHARYFIRIKDKRNENLCDISYIECLREGIREYNVISVEAGKRRRTSEFIYENPTTGLWYPSPYKAFAALIDEINGKGTWDSNPIVTRYEFELLK